MFATTVGRTVKVNSSTCYSQHRCTTKRPQWHKSSNQYPSELDALRDEVQVESKFCVFVFAEVQ